ncbi:SGNH/GDSL hydrolase family protein [Nocardiopsis sp. MT53]|uniref:SGNH/GDSL hydrolase family protein n=1 Tax=Nocardiopsis changdeensis TaxID=2831969 RepID=A0ABX8BWV7_9ACTN|nr:SGNH/GDSL hydrolase family protein [Nocardiopsis changdeensis]QYX39974.1 SGNH/GDSL hydrolase family protein [Nocardiopsis sp. MT53]
MSGTPGETPDPTPPEDSGNGTGKAAGKAAGKAPDTGATARPEPSDSTANPEDPEGAGSAESSRAAAGTETVGATANTAAPGNAGDAGDPEVPTDTEGTGATARPPRRRTRLRTRIGVGVSLVLVLSLIVMLTVPAGRDSLRSLWCEITGGVCPAEDLPPITEEEQADWRERVSPQDGALWGNYVALGDSYSSGDGAGDYAPETAVPGGCWRSSNAYAHLIEDEFDFAGSLAFYACSSHKGREMLDELGTPESQIERVTEHTSLVTLGIGGNDLGFIPVLRTCIVRMPLLESGVCTEQEEDIEKRMRQFEETLDTVIAEIRERAPDARLLVLGYPRLFPEEPPAMYYTLTVNDQLWLNGIAERFNERIRNAVYRADGDVYGSRGTGSVEYVNTFSALAGHEVSAEDAWLNGIVLGRFGEGLKVDRATFHPTAQGQMSIAERVRLQIVEGPERVLYVSRETLERVDESLLNTELGGPLDPVHAPSGGPSDAASASPSESPVNEAGG